MQMITVRENCIIKIQDTLLMQYVENVQKVLKI